MSLGPQLFETLTPPEVWVHLGPISCHEADTRTLTVRVRPAGGRSVTGKVEVSRYSPEGSVFRAVAQTIDTLESAQEAVTTGRLSQVMAEAADRWVEPF